jgi:aflatoxin B1 aldehyde reductase
MVKVIVGLMGSSVASGSPRMSTPSQLTSLLNAAKSHHIHELDTARIYGSGASETLLGHCTPLSHTFSISTKAPGFTPGSLTAEKIQRSCNTSLAALKCEKMDIFYFHGPDRQTPLEEQCRAADGLYRQGKFERFGVCNLRADEVERIHDICESEGYVLPSVYQGGFNPLQRRAEFELLPTLRRLGMSYYGFSPLGGGYFSRSAAELREPPKGGRMEQMKIFKDIYVNETSLELLGRLTEVCERHGVKVKEATLRWYMHHGPLGDGDGIILGASSVEQLEENLNACEGGPLPEEIVKGFEDMWEGYKEKAGAYFV